MLKIIELFGGIGACSKALERLGIDYEIVDYVEIDKYAVKSFNAIHNTNFEPQDITTWDKDIKVDLIMHGSPCQDFSLAGKQAGGDKDSGTRSSLMYETIRIVEKLKPKYVIWENVKNLLSKKHRHNFDAYLETMEQLGYINYYQVLNAKDYGIPQNRERVFTVSIRDDSGIRKGAFLGTFYLEDYEANNFEFPPKQELKTTMHNLLEENVEAKYYLSEKMTKYVTEKNEKSNFKVFRPHYAGEEKIAHTIQTSGGNRADDNFIVFHFPQKQELKLKLKDMLEDEVDEKYYLSDKQLNYVLDMKDVALKSGRDINDRIVNPQIAKTISCRGAVDQRADVTNFTIDNCNEELKVKDVKQFISNKYKNFIEENGYIHDMFNPYNTSEIKEIAPTQTTQRGSTTSSATILIRNATKKGYQEAYEGDSVNLADPTSKTRRGRVGNQVSQTLQTSDNIGVVVDKPRKDKTKLRIRKLTPLEVWRLMGFDDEDFEKASKVNSNTQLYKQAGNSICVPVLMAIFKDLIK